MFEAEPIKTSDGPRVYLLSMNADPLGDIASADMMFAGRVVRSLDEVTDEERIYHFKELTKTRLVAPFEFVSFHFLIEGVTRAFTHQLVRQRQATYVQESMRFAVKSEMPVALPPSLAGTKDRQAIIRDLNIADGLDPLTRNFISDGDWTRLSEVQRQRVLWDESVEFIEDHYNRLIAMGMPAEDARGIAPTNVLTRIHYRTDLHALLSHAGNRLCTQAQFEWRQVFSQIAQAIRNYTPDFSWAAGEINGRDIRGEMDLAWDVSMRPKQDVLASHFAPICYATGKCEFMANVDRHCSIRNRVEANHDIGRKSDMWGFEYDQVVGNPIVAGVGPRSVMRESAPGEDEDDDVPTGKPVFIGAIEPAEWLLDPTAARTR